MSIPFNKPYVTGKEFFYIADAGMRRHLSGDGHYTELCSTWLEKEIGVHKALLTNSCTSALEMTAILADIQPGDEVILPSYTFVSTASAFVLRGAVPVFIDVREDTLNIDESLIEQAITPQTKAIIPVHYAGVGCEMESICAIARDNNLLVIEDAAHGCVASYRARPLGSIGNMAAFSFHETKNIISGEGGALLLNDERFFERAEILREKGTNRSKFFRGEVDKYTWVDLGSSYLPGELTAAFLWAQMEEAHSITQMRIELWDSYHKALEDLETAGLLSRPVVPTHCRHNAHMYYVLLADASKRQKVIDKMREADIHLVFHYIPLHNSPAGRIYGRVSGNMDVTESIADRILRLPLWPGMETSWVHRVVQCLADILH